MKYPDFSPGLITMAYTGSLSVGMVVKITANDTVAAGTDGAGFFGVAKVVDDDNYCGVEFDGILEAEYTGTDPTVGNGILIGGASGKVKTNATGTEVHILRVDTTAKKVWFIKQ